MMTFNDFAKAFFANKELVDLFAYLYYRWHDECEYEDLNDYAEVLTEACHQHGLDANIPHPFSAPQYTSFGFILECSDAVGYIFIDKKGQMTIAPQGYFFTHKTKK